MIPFDHPLSSALDGIVSGNSLYYGTNLLSRNMILFLSPFEWNSPNEGLSAQPDKWLCLGQSSYWADVDTKRRYKGIEIELGDELPSSPGEWVYFDNR